MSKSNRNGVILNNMQIKRLTLTPLSKGWPDAVIDSPSAERAGRLIKERLSSGFSDPYTPVNVPKKIPKFLKGFVNPKSMVSHDTKFITTG